jgi:putative flippase GtrA
MIHKIWSKFINFINYFLHFEFIRFSVVGVLNTLVDFGLLNIFMFVTGITSGWTFIGIRSFTFLCGVLVSFMLNKGWTFKSLAIEKRNIQFVQFVIVSMLTLCINNIITAFLLPYNIFALNRYLWANIATFIGALVAILIRYFMSKKWVFKTQI